MTNKHSTLSPSSSGIWLNCRQYRSLKDQCKDLGLPDFGLITSQPAETGKLLHEIASNIIRDIIQDYSENPEIEVKLDKSLPPAYSSHRETLKVYLTYIFNLYAEASKLGKVVFGIESSVPLFYLPEDSGTVDFFIIVGKTLYVVDLKTGFQDVNPNCSQLKIYASSIYKKLDLAYFRIMLVIVQGGEVKEYTFSRSSRAGFESKCKNYVSSNIHTAKLGEHCTYCPVKIYCSKYLTNRLKVKPDGINLNPTHIIKLYAELSSRDRVYEQLKELIRVLISEDMMDNIPHTVTTYRKLSDDILDDPRLKEVFHRLTYPKLLSKSEISRVLKEELGSDNIIKEYERKHTRIKLIN